MESAARADVYLAPANVTYAIHEEAIKTNGAEQVPREALEQQAEAAVACLEAVDYGETPGTCGDERERVGLLDGSSRVEARPSVFGGPNIYGLGIAELTGYFGDADSDGETRLTRVTDLLEDARDSDGNPVIVSGGHVHCAANEKLNVWMGVIADNPDAVKAYARMNMGRHYDESLMDAVISRAAKVVASKRYGEWTEEVLQKVLGKEKADVEIERLADKPHEGVTLVRNKIPDSTVNQTKLVARSVIGEGSFVHDDPYAGAIEHVITSGPDAVRMKQQAEHAREAILAAVAAIVPNEEIYQLDLSPSA